MTRQDMVRIISNGPLYIVFWIIVCDRRQLPCTLADEANENMVDVVECKLTMLGAEYRGYINITEFGKVCQQWGSSTPHISYFKHLADQKNYCRNPDHEPNGPWCYTIDPNVRWQYCDIPYCESTIERETSMPVSTQVSSSKTEVSTTEVKTMEPTNINTPETTVPPTKKSSDCFCPCDRVTFRNISQEDVQKYIRDLKQKLSIDKRITSTFIRKQISVSDKRHSSQTIGMTGAVILIVLVFSLFLNDCVRLYSHCSGRRR